MAASNAPGMAIHDKHGDEQELAKRNYVRFDSNVEKVAENEEADIKAVADMINEIQKAQYNSHRHCYSGMEDCLS